MSAARESALRVALVFPELLGTYGDRGNAEALVHRMRVRSRAVELLEVAAGDPVPAGCDIYVLGGAEDSAERVAAELLAASPLPAAAQSGTLVFGVCAGFQILGTSIDLGDGRPCPGLGLIDAVTAPGEHRTVGEVALDTRREALGLLVGFENHRARTRLGAAQRPLAWHRDAAAEPDGVDTGTIVGTYLHGPVLARNPVLADDLLARVVGPLPPIDGDLAAALHTARVEAVTRMAMAPTRRLAARVGRSRRG
jgi:CobQ-like glutamine amidotransferase family enzyme